MQAEHPRYGGFIIAPFGQSVPKETKKAVYKKRKLRIGFFTAPLCAFFSECFQCHHLVFAGFAKKLLSAGVFLCCILVFFSFFTFGTGIYYNGRQIAVCSGEDSFTSALQDAESFASSYNIKVSDLSFSTLPTLSLRSNITVGTSLRDNLLLCSSEFIRGCTVFTGDDPVFTVKDEKSAQSAIDQYIAQYSVSENTEISTNLTYRTNIVAKSEISDFDKCLALLSNNDSVKVISVINTTDSQNIPFETQTKHDPSLYIGEEVTITKGKYGSEQIASEIVYENGTQIEKKILSRQIVSVPVAEVVHIGTKPKDVLKTGLFYPL